MKKRLLFLKENKKLLLFIFFLITCLSKIHSQTVTVEIKIDELYCFSSNPIYSDFYIKRTVNESLKNFDCWGTNQSAGLNDVRSDYRSNLKTFQVDLADSIVTFAIYAWIDGGCGNYCDYNDGCGGGRDDWREENVFKFNLFENPPGVFSTLPYNTRVKDIYNPGVTGLERYGAKFRVRYSIPQPGIIQIKNTDVTYAQANVPYCTDKLTTLKTSVNLPHKTGLVYDWSYHFAGDVTYSVNSNFEYSLRNVYSSVTNTQISCVKSQLLQDHSITLETAVVSCLGHTQDIFSQFGTPAFTTAKADFNLIKTDSWYNLKTSPTDSVNFNPLSELFSGDYQLVGNGTNVNFRVKARANSPGGLESAYSTELQSVLFLPPGPTISSYETVASCSNKSTGKIIIHGLKGFSGLYDFVLLKGGNNTSLCDSKKDVANKNCIAMVDTNGSIPAGSTNFSIDNIPAGSYTLKLLAKGIDGACSNRIFNITVNNISDLQISSSPTNISCFGANDGSLTFAPVNGKSPYTINVIDPGGNTLFNQVSTGSNLSNLKPGKYKISITDFCQMVTQYITIIEPMPVSVAKDQFGKEIFETNGSTCANPGNGILKMQTAGGSPTNAKYKYILYKYNFNKTDSTAYRTKNYDVADAQNNQWILNDLEEGKYNLYLYDAERNCKPFIKYFEISGLALIVIKNVKTSNITCFGTNQGSISITPFGGTGKYKYRIKNTGSGLVTDQSDSTFTNLYAGTYQITLLTGEPGCQDNYLYPSSIIISEADKIVISTSKTDIKCNGDNNATITATVQGGSGAFNYTWEKNINNQWSSFATDKLSLDKLSGGTYHLKVQDKSTGTCEIISDQIIISEPDALLITAVKQVRPGCVSDHVYLKPILSGGTLPYKTLYALDGVNYTQFDDNTLLGLGTYSIKVTDGNNCSYTFPDPVKITENAVNITVKALAVCYKQANGKIKLTAEGGELPYQYSIDNGQSYNDKPDFDNVATGSYNIIVKDNRGCSGIATATIEQRKDKPEIDFLVSSLQNALDTIVVVDISRPLPDKVKWIFDSKTQVIDSLSTSPKIRFPNPGTYQVVMNASFGDCEYSLGETITIKPYDPNTPKALLPGVRPIEVFSITPNPNTGEFTVKVTLVKSHALVILIYDVRGNEVYRKNWQDIKEINEAIKLPDSQSGAFLVRVITENDAKELKMIVNK